MENVLIVIHLLVVIALVVVVLLQRSEGGGLGMGNAGGAMSARGQADTLTRTTGILAAVFFVTSISLGVLARYGDNPTSILDRIGNGNVETQNGAPATGGGILDQLGGAEAPTTSPTGVPTQ
ncbi:MAG: preprotein translocase subunit SecG [Ahrensia sp.]|nr:preprotein translocase subunit SecG [Ahrensia sp.]